MRKIIEKIIGFVKSILHKAIARLIMAMLAAFALVCGYWGALFIFFGEGWLVGLGILACVIVATRPIVNFIKDNLPKGEDE